MNVRRLTNEAATYGVGKGIEAAAGIAVLSVVGRYLSAHLFGTAELITATVGLLYLGIGLNLHQALTRYYYDADSNSLNATHTAMLLANGALQLLIGWVVVASVWLRVESPVAWAVALALVLANVLYDQLATVFRLRHEPSRYLALVSINMGGWCIFTPLLLVVFGMGVEAIFIGKFIGATVALIAMVPTVWSSMRGAVDWGYARRSLRFALPTIPATIAAWGLVSGPRYFVEAWATRADVGYYGVAGRFGYIMAMVGMAGIMTWTPFAMKEKDSPRAPEMLGRGLLFFVALNCIAAVFVAAFSHEEVLLVVGPKYAEAASVVGPLMVAHVCFNISLFLFVQVSIAEKTYWQSVSYAIGVVAMAALNVVLIPRFASLGAAIASVVGQAMTTVVMYIGAQHFFPIRVPLGRIVGLVAVIGVAVVLSELVEASVDSLATAVAQKSVVVLLCWGAIVALLGRSEIGSVRSFIGDILRRHGGADVDRGA